MVIDWESWFKDYSSFLFLFFFVTTVTGLLNISLPLGIYEDVVFTKLPFTFFFLFLSDVEFTKYFFRLDENNMFNLK